jgi:hypothetical protein
MKFTVFEKVKDIVLTIFLFIVVIITIELLLGNGIDILDISYILGTCVGYMIAIITHNIHKS